MYGIATLYDSHFSNCFLHYFVKCRNPTTSNAETFKVWLFPGRSLAYGGITIFVFFSLQVIRCFSSLRFLPYGMVCLQHTGLPHSEICGSMVICTLPAAYRSLSRSFIASGA